MAEIVQFRLPDGNVVTVKLIDLGRDLNRRDGGVTIEPVSDNFSSVHHIVLLNDKIKNSKHSRGC